PVGPAVAVEPWGEHLDTGEPAALELIAEDRPMVLPEELDELVVTAPPGAVEIQDLDWLAHRGWTSWLGRRSRAALAPASAPAAARSSSHARSTCRGSVRRLPIATRIVNRPRSFVWLRKISPVALAA